MLAPDTPLKEVIGIGPVMVKRLAGVDVATVAELLEYYPFRHEDLSKVSKISEIRIGQEATIQAAVQNVTTARTSRRRMMIVRATLVDESGHIAAIWFNQPFLVRTLAVGSQWIFHGKVEFDRSSGNVLVSPSYDKQAGILPVYHETEGLTSKWLRRIVRPLLHVTDQTEDYLPEPLRKRYEIMPLFQAIKAIHFPADAKQLKQAKERLGFDELFVIGLRLLEVKEKLSHNRAPAMALNEALLKQFAQSLPYKLTNAQRRSAWEILKDIEKPRPMNRLLEGEVGSGKTVVGTMAALVVSKHNYQTAWLAPTEILANQHYATVSALLKPFNVSVSLMTRTTKHGTDSDVVIGTHALLQEHVTFKKLGLVIVDEQHRFGVKQRGLLKGTKGEIPHFLSMTATPIPRTLALALYGDLDISMIDELPAGRQKIVTNVIEPEQRHKAYNFIREQVKQGRQVYVITPLIEERQPKVSQTLFDELERKSAVKEYEKLRSEIFPDLRIGLLHGRLKGKEKESVMAQFKSKKLDILVSTAVVEVGIDVRNATVMMIEDADRFGLAQLHQFRGRVGRGEHQSYCFLFASAQGSLQRLKAMEQYDNGFKLAEVDLQMRGPGEMVGIRQSGLPDLKMASLSDTLLIRKARELAKEVVSAGIEKFPAIEKKLEEFERIHHLE